MRRPRFRGPKGLRVAYFHCVSRVVGRQLLLGEDEKAHFLRLMRLYEKLCGLRIVSYCLMSNHFHLLVEVPRRPGPEALPDDSSLVQLVRSTLGDKAADELAWQLGHFRSSGNPEAAEALRQQWFARMWDISSFMKTLKQRFTQWFNRRHQRKGTLWEDRFRSVLVEGECHALRSIAAYIDLNPVRAGLCDDPARYRWCGYAEALAGGRLARRALAFLDSLRLHGPSGGQRPEQAGDSKAGKPADPEAKAPEVLRRWRCWLFGIPENEGAREEARRHEQLRPGTTPIRSRVPRETALEVLSSGGRIDLASYLRCRVRYFTDGLVIGCREFVEAAFQAGREHFPASRRSGARLLRGQPLSPKPERLYAIRQLQKGVFG